MEFANFIENFTTNTPVIIVFFFTMVPLLLVSLAAKSSIATASDFFLHNRSMNTAISFVTVYATWWSSFAFLGSISYFYSIGSVYWTGIGWNVLFGILYMLFGIKICQYGKKRGYITPIDFFDDIFQSGILSKLVLVIMIVFTFPYLQIQFYGGALMIQIATKGLIPWQIGALMFYLVMIIYIWAGGLKAIAWADIFYSVLIFVGMLMAGYILISVVGGVNETFDLLTAQRPDLILLTEGSPNGVGLWISMFFMIPLGELMGPQMWIRMYATREQKTFYTMPLLISIFTIAYLGSMLAGSAAVILKPAGAVAASDTILPVLLVEYAPSWVMAVVLCCGAAACLSTANSEIHAVSALLTLDVYKKHFRPKATESHTVLVAKICILAFSALAYLALVLNKMPGSIVGTGFMAMCGMAQIVVPVTGALLWPKSNPIGAILGLLSGVLFTLLFSLNGSGHFPLHPGLLALFLNAGVFILFSLILPQNNRVSEKILFYRNGDFE